MTRPSRAAWRIRSASLGSMPRARMTYGFPLVQPLAEGRLAAGVELEQADEGPGGRVDPRPGVIWSAAATSRSRSTVVASRTVPVRS